MQLNSYKMSQIKMNLHYIAHIISVILIAWMISIIFKTDNERESLSNQLVELGQAIEANEQAHVKMQFAFIKADKELKLFQESTARLSTLLQKQKNETKKYRVKVLELDSVVAHDSARNEVSRFYSEIETKF